VASCLASLRHDNRYTGIHDLLQLLDTLDLADDRDSPILQPSSPFSWISKGEHNCTRSRRLIEEPVKSTTVFIKLPCYEAATQAGEAVRSISDLCDGSHVFVPGPRQVAVSAAD